jgi:large subunit ribosomal protein L4e
MIMQVNVYKTDGKVEKKIALPRVFERSYNKGIIRRALLSEQSTRYQPQGHYLLAGLQTTATYVGRYSTYRTLRHVGQAIRPRQKLAKGAMGDVRRIPSSVKGRRAHPHKIEKNIVERINRKEYVMALESAVAGTANADEVRKSHAYRGESFPIVVSSQIESIAKTKDLLKVLEALSLSEDIEKSHTPKARHGLRRKVQRRYFRNSVLIVAKDATRLSRSGRNIPGVEVSGVSALDIGKLAPGANPRLTVWSESAIPGLEESISKAKPRCAA